jgi:hypothetical protein
MRAIRRADDDELCGWVAERHDEWVALTVFGGLLASFATVEQAEQCVLERGLAALAQRWTLIDPTTAVEQIVCLQEADPTSVTVVLGYYAMPGVPTLRLHRADLDTGRYVLRLDP